MLRVTERFLDRVQEERAKALVTEVMKVMDNQDDRTLVKGLVKEFIYSSFRELAKTIKAFNEGLMIEFKPPKE